MSIEKKRQPASNTCGEQELNHHEFDDIKHKGVDIDFDFGKVWKEHEEFVDRLKETLNLHEPGVKDDSDKPRLDLVLGDFADALWEVGKVGTFGANKYTDRGWHEVENGRERYASALLRHYFKFKKGEYFDDESKLLHLSHMAWNALAILQLELEDIQFNEILKGNLPTIEEVAVDHPDFKPICSYKYDCHYKEDNK